MNPDQPPVIETEQSRFRAAFASLDDWIEEQKRNKQAGRVKIDPEYLIEVVSGFQVAAQSWLAVETDAEKRATLSTIEEKSRKALGGLGSISDLYEQIDVFVAAKRLLLEAHEEAIKLLS